MRLAIITARGGSKRIPRKNIKNFLGKPIINYTIDAAIGSGMFDEVMISTDDDEIAEIGKAAGAVVPFMRSEKTANDYATTADVVAEVLSTYEKMGRHFEEVCVLYPTAPFVTSDAIKEAMDILTNSGCDSVLPVVKFSFPPQRCVVIGEDGRITPKWPECMPMRSQDLEPYYHDCGQFYCIRSSSFMKQNKIVMDNCMPFIQDEMNVQDIDTEEDWKIAEMKYRILHQG
ncbi:MAG: pseudaminic acid cytidylyltransferase [Lachnospiraceae bacterium]|nr:pseudaminic acid cytidylyltransferase [Candidatus Merdinaster equi]